MRRAACAVATLLALTISSTAALAEWPRDPAAGLLACSAVNFQSTPGIAPDGSGGMFYTWYDFRNAGQADIYVQHFDARGNELWTANGVAVCTAVNQQYYPKVVADGQGGAIVVWQDWRSGANYDIYAQRVNAAGVVAWAANGIAVCSSANDQFTPVIASDGANGAIIGWVDFRSGTSLDLYVQRLNSSGTALFSANGAGLCTATGDQNELQIVSDGAGSTWFAWSDQRSGNSDVYVQRLSNLSIYTFGTNGSAACTVANGQTGPCLANDGSGGVYVAWRDGRSGTADVYAQHATTGSVTNWGFGGLAVCVNAADQTGVAIGPDGAGNAIVAWSDQRNGTYDIYAQRLLPSGTATGATDGVAVCTAGGDQVQPELASDGSGGAIVVWQDGRSLVSYDLYAQRFTSAAGNAWASNGVPVCIAVGLQYETVVIPDDAGGVLLGWTDLRTGGYDVYAGHVDYFGMLGDAAPAIVSVKDVKNDQGGWVKVSWNGSYLDADPTYSILEYRLFRSAPSALTANGTRRAVTNDPDVAVAEGALLVQPSSAQAIYWEYVGTQTAEALGTYSKVVATTSDSLPGSFPRTYFIVEARSSTSLSASRWFSAPDSGYSVDNLAPAAPAPLTGQYAAGTTALHWNRNAEADLAGYRLYRGSSAAFTPSPANFVAELPDTGTADAAGAPYVYKLTAVDVHGNESPVATLIPSGTLGADGAARAELAFATPSPNPARGATVFRWSLPAAGRVTLALYDAAGRRVATVQDGMLPAGAHTAAFALRDEAGHELAAGLYLARLEAGGRRLTRRIAVVR